METDDAKSFASEIDAITVEVERSHDQRYCVWLQGLMRRLAVEAAG